MVAMLLLLLHASPVMLPSIYWSSSPTLVNETLLLAGAGLAGVVARFCNDSVCSSPIGSGGAGVWDRSLQAVMPACGPPCHIELSSAAGLLRAPINPPDVWWASEMHPSTLNFSQLTPHDPLLLGHLITLRAGEHLRVFGRSLAWDASQLCVGGPPRPNAGTTLALMPAFVTEDAASVIMAASAAACYEATFALPPSLPSGEYIGIVRTAWGDSAPLSVHVSDRTATRAPLVLDVQAGFQGDLMAALAAAAAATSKGTAVQLVLGAHTYPLVTELHVPPNTTLRGSGASSTRLVFTLPAGSWRAIRVGSGVSLHNFTLELTDTKVAGITAVRAQRTQGFYAAGLTVILQLPSGIAIDLGEARLD